MLDLDTLQYKVQQVTSNHEPNCIDYIGINLDEVSATFKIYYDYDSYGHSLRPKNKGLSQLIDSICGNEAAHIACSVDDGHDHDRYEIKIDTISDQDLLTLIHRLSESFSPLKKRMSEILYLSQMKVLDKSNYAALYYVGLIVDKSIINAVKLRFTTRYQEGTCSHYRNQYYIKYIDNAHISEFTTLLNAVAPLVHQNQYCNVHLIGIDYINDNLRKYKIYFKLVQPPERCLMNWIRAFCLSNQITYFDTPEGFAIGSLSLTLDGIALALTTDGKITVNLYYKFT